MKKTSRWVVVGLVVAALGGGGAFAAQQLSKADDVPAGRVVKVTRGTLVDVAAASGTIEPTTQVEVKSRISGEVIELSVAEGDQVEAGQLLVRLDPTDAERALKEAKTSLRRVQAEVAQAAASLDAAKLDVTKKKDDEATAEKGASMGLTSEQGSRDAVHAARSAVAVQAQRSAALASSGAQLEAARFAVEEAERNVGYTQIVAPIAGTVLSLTVERGTIVSSALTNVSGGTGIVTLADLDDLRVVGSVDEAQIGRVGVEQDVTVRVDAYAERTFTGRVDRVANLGQTVSNVVTFDVEVVVTDPDAYLLKPGMSADLEIVVARTEDAVLVPLVAIQSAGGRRLVTLVSGERKPLRTGPNDGTHIQVLEGVAPGDEILITTAQPAAGATSRQSGGMGMGMGMGGPQGGRK